MYFWVKVFLTALIVAAVSEVAKRFTALGAVLASLPLTSVLAIIWLYHDTRDAALTGRLAGEILWALLPSLAFFILFPWFLRRGMPFPAALAAALLLMALGYLAYLLAAGRPLS